MHTSLGRKRARKQAQSEVGPGERGHAEHLHLYIFTDGSHFQVVRGAGRHASSRVPPLQVDSSGDSSKSSPVARRMVSRAPMSTRRTRNSESEQFQVSECVVWFHLRWRPLLPPMNGLTCAFFVLIFCFFHINSYNRDCCSNPKNLATHGPWSHECWSQQKVKAGNEVHTKKTDEVRTPIFQHC